MDQGPNLGDPSLLADMDQGPNLGGSKSASRYGPGSKSRGSKSASRYGPGSKSRGIQICWDTGSSPHPSWTVVCLFLYVTVFASGHVTRCEFSCNLQVAKNESIFHFSQHCETNCNACHGHCILSCGPYKTQTVYCSLGIKRVFGPPIRPNMAFYTKSAVRSLRLLTVLSCNADANIVRQVAGKLALYGSTLKSDSPNFFRSIMNLVFSPQRSLSYTFV